MINLCPAQRMLISSSLTATMAYLATDGLSSITDGQIMWLDIKRCHRERQALRARPLRRHRIDGKAERLIWARAEIQNELTLEMNGMLSSPLSVLDFDIFDISEEDAFDSLYNRGIGSFGYEFFDHVDDAEWWDENRRDHSTVTDNPEFCRIDQCDGECWH